MANRILVFFVIERIRSNYCSQYLNVLISSKFFAEHEAEYAKGKQKPQLWYLINARNRLMPFNLELLVTSHIKKEIGITRVSID